MSGGGGSTTTTQQNYSPEEAARRTRVQDIAGGIYDTTAGSYTAAGYPGAKPVGFSPESTEAQQRILDYSKGQGAGFTSSVGNAAAFGLGPVLYPESNPALQGTIDTAVRRVGQSYTDPGGVLSQIRGGFTAGDSAGSGTREGIAGGIAGREYLNTVGDVSSRIASQGYGQGLNFMQGTMGMAPAIYNLGQAPALSEAAVGAQREAQGQAGEQYQAAAREYALNAPWMGLQNYANIVYGGSNPMMTSQMSGGQGNPLMQMIGLGAMLSAFL